MSSCQPRLLLWCTAVICHLPMLGLGLWAVTKSQYFIGSCCLNLPGKSNLHYTKMNHMLLRNRFPLSCVTLFPHLDKTISSISFFIWKGSWEIHFLRSCISENFLNLSLDLVDTATIFYAQNHSPSEFWRNHFWCYYWISLIPNPVYATRFFSLKDFGVYDNMLWFSPSYSNSLCWVLSGPFQSGSSCSSVLGNFLVLCLW